MPHNEGDVMSKAVNTSTASTTAPTDATTTNKPGEPPVTREGEVRGDGPPFSDDGGDEVTARAINFKNPYHTKVWVALNIPTGECAQRWMSTGWFDIDAGRTEQIFTSYDSVFSYYAKSADGRVVWESRDRGDWVPVHQTREFKICRGDGMPGAETVRTIVVDLSSLGRYQSYTVHL